MPDVTGQELEEAEQLLNATGLLAKAVPEYSDSVRVNEVIESRPRSGTEAAQGSTVSIVVSAGYAPRRVPKMVDVQAQKALNLLGRSGLGVGSIDTVYRQGAKAGNVLETSPPAGTVLTRNSAVDVVIAGPPPTVSVPSVEGLSQSRAEGEVVDAGLTVKLLLLQVPRKSRRWPGHQPGCSATDLRRPRVRGGTDRRSSAAAPTNAAPGHHLGPGDHRAPGRATGGHGRRAPNA